MHQIKERENGFDVRLKKSAMGQLSDTVTLLMRIEKQNPCKGSNLGYAFTVKDEAS